MSNTKRPAGPVPPRPDDYGLGLCLSCLGEVMTGNRGSAEYGITLAPMLWPPVPDGVPVAVPACWEHVQAAGKPPPPRRRLLAANGR
jgi:hypothetical protein